MSRKYVLTVEEFAEEIKVSITTAYRMLADGTGPPHRHARRGQRSRIIIPIAGFERWLEETDDEPKPIAQ